MPKLQFPRGDDRSRVFEFVLVVLLAALVVRFNLKRRHINEGQRPRGIAFELSRPDTGRFGLAERENILFLIETL